MKENIWVESFGDVVLKTDSIKKALSWIGEAEAAIRGKGLKAREFKVIQVKPLAAVYDGKVADLTEDGKSLPELMNDVKNFK